MEKELAAKAKKGDKEAFCRLYGLYKNKLYRYAYYRLGNPQDAEDAVADAVVSAFEQIKSLRNTKAFSPWIFKILRASCSKYIKLQITQRETENIEDLENTQSVSQSLSNESTELCEALNILKPQEKEIVLLSVVAGFNSREIAEITGLTASNVRSKLSRSLAKMRSFLQ